LVLWKYWQFHRLLFDFFFQIFEIHGHISESVLWFFGNHVA
jgi:hypothetical protein